ncbi:hypothetical protein DFH94DRAFT_355621 [Russula ochroleuca]|uniref:Uncharacterized protein n=1 Tax=Russula ochroleuca TaxID=152965 RepID=A0A9P5JW82_9AGAM|nr:hypothetical protein DFH94DRAFT_355621 [Russula ochroleuca]
MRFTTSSALTNALIIFTLALLSLIPAADAQAGEIDIVWISPSAGDIHFVGQESEIKWLAGGDGIDLINITCELWLHGPYEIAYQLTGKIGITNSTSGPMTYPAQAIPSNEYYIFMETFNRLEFHSDNFTIAYQ